MSEVLYKKLEKQGRAEIQEVSKITALINEAVSKTRTLAQGLYPVELKEAGLPAMLERLANKTKDIYKIECVFTGEMKCEIDDDLVAINLYRIAQEAVNNAVKYSGANKITVALKSEPSVTILEIADNGCGIDNLAGSDAKNGLGMHSMQFRATLLGASLRIGVPLGGGTSIAVSLPVKKKDSSHAI
jgi:signal transduction histidine kinase